jgi:glycosyltransferase involved in cell wall biosynthesis
MVRVSVVIPTYNRAHILPEVLEHVLQQTFQDFDVWILDDGSEDGTHEAIAGYLNTRVRYVRQNNRGVSAARNAGIQVSSGEFIAFLDSDDLWSHNKLARQLAFFDRHPNINVVCCDLVKFGDESSGPFAQTMPVFSTLIQQYRIGDECIIPSHDMYACLLEELPFRPSTLVARRHTLTACTFNTAIRRSEDWEFFLRLARQEVFGFIDMPLVQLRIWPEGKHLRGRADGYKVSIQVLQKEGASQALAPPYRAALRRGIRQRYYLLGHYHLRNGFRMQAAIAFFRGFLVSRNLRMFQNAVASFFPDTILHTIQRRKQKNEPIHNELEPTLIESGRDTVSPVDERTV